MATNKNNPTLKDTFGTAYQNYRKGDLKTAEILCYKILSIDPTFIESKILLANISAKNRNFNESFVLASSICSGNMTFCLELINEFEIIKFI